MTRAEKKTQYIKQIMVRLSKVYRPQSFAYQCIETALRKFSSTELDCFYIMLITSQDSIESVKPTPKTLNIPSILIKTNGHPNFQSIISAP